MSALGEQLEAAALAYDAAGFCIVPVRADGTKAPAAVWKQYQTSRPSPDFLKAWFRGGHFDGLGIITGTVSGRCEMLELEGRAVEEGLVDRLVDALRNHGLEHVFAKLCAHMERTPSGGLHFLYRVNGEPRRNTKLASRPSTEEELARWKADQLAGIARETAWLDEHEDQVEDVVLEKRRGELARRLVNVERMTAQRLPQVLVETRGEGGFTVLAPSAGRTHDTGAAWALLAGGPATVPTLEEGERDQLYAVAMLLDQMPVDPTKPTAPSGSTGDGSGDRPGDEWNQKATWAEILEPHGWVCTGKIGTGYGWKRPNKTTANALSAVSGTRLETGDNLFVFSSATIFDANRPYSKFGAYAELEHGGDYAAATRALGKRGYGKPYQPPEHPRGAFDGIIDPGEPCTSPTTSSPAPASTATATTSSPAAGAASQTSTPTRSAPVTPSEPASSSAPTTEGNLATVHQLEPPAPEEPAPPHLRAVETYTRTDDGNAMRFADLYSDELRFVPQRGRWLRKVGHRWEWDDARVVVERARAVARTLPKETDLDVRHREKSLGRDRVKAMVDLASSDPAMVVAVDQLDGDPWALCTPDGVVDLDPEGRCGVRRPTDTMHTRSTAVSPDFDMPTPHWDAFLLQTFGDDDEGRAMVAFVRRLCGYSATGAVTHHVLPFLFGSGGNGKSVFLDVMRALLGDYASTAPHGFLMAGRTAHETEKARLVGLRFVICSEVNQEDRFDEAKLKELTGGDALTARFLHQDYFTFVPTHHLWLTGNQHPAVRAGGESFWRRLRLLPFTRVVPTEKRIHGLDRRLVDEEGPGILAWIITGAREAMRDGLGEPASVLAATKAYADEEDPLGRFVEQRLLIGGGEHVKTETRNVRGAYEAWCREEGEVQLPGQTFGRELRARFHEDVGVKRSHGRAYYTGLSLRADDEPEE